MKIDYEPYFRTWGWFHALVEEIPSLQPMTLALESEGNNIVQGEAIKLNQTERGGGSLLGLHKRYPIESRINRLVQERLDREQRIVFIARYALKAKSGEPLSIAKVSRLVALTPKQVENRLKKGRGIILDILS